MKREDLKGTGTLIILLIKRDRLRLLLWIAGIFFLIFSMTATFSQVFTDDAEIISMISMFMANPAMRAFLAPASGVSLGSFVMMRSSTVFAVLIALFSSMTVIRHTRQNEENGRAELIGSTIVGRHAGLISSLVVSVAANIILILLIAAAFLSFSLPAGGSLAAALSLGMTGIVFAGLAAVSAQIAESSRGANGIAGLCMGAAFLFSAIGNMLGKLDAGGTELSSAWPVWLSPFGWYQQVYSFQQNRIVILLLPLTLFALTTIVALKLEQHRDVGMGMIAAGRGPARAVNNLCHPLGLAFRLQRNTLGIWLIVMIVFGSIFGLSSGEFNEAISELDRATDIFGNVFGMEEVFMMIIIGILGSFTIIYTVQAFNRMAGEEKNGFLEPLLATKLGKLKWLASHLIFIFAGTSIVLLITGLAGAIASMGNPEIRFEKIIESAALQIPAALVIAGIALLMYGLFPRWSSIVAWSALGISLIAGPFLGPALDLPTWLQNLSPFTHVPSPMDDMSTLPVIILCATALLLSIAGMAAFYRRSIRKQ